MRRNALLLVSSSPEIVPTVKRIPIAESMTWPIMPSDSGVSLEPVKVVVASLWLLPLPVLVFDAQQLAGRQAVCLGLELLQPLLHTDVKHQLIIPR